MMGLRGYESAVYLCSESGCTIDNLPGAQSPACNLCWDDSASFALKSNMATSFLSWIVQPYFLMTIANVIGHKLVQEPATLLASVSSCLGGD